MPKSCGARGGSRHTKTERYRFVRREIENVAGFTQVLPGGYPVVLPVGCHDNRKGSSGRPVVVSRLAARYDGRQFEDIPRMSLDPRKSEREYITRINTEYRL